MYLTPTERHWACDIEADGLYSEATKIYCVTLLNCVTKEETHFLTDTDFRIWQESHPDIIYVGHNFLSYDAPMLNRFWGAKIPAKRVVDTFVLSQVYDPNFTGGHSLKVWGERLRYPKFDFDDFTHYTPEMLTYCRRDTRLTALLYRRLSERMRQVGFSERGVELEHLAWNIIQNKQYRNGFPFDYEKAHQLYVILRAREEELKNEIYKLWPPRLEVIAEYPKSTRKDGSDTANFTRHCGQYPKVERDSVTGSYRVFDWVEFSLGSPKQRIDKLLDLGWEPANRTKAGNPKVDEDELLAFAETSGLPEVKALSKWIVINSRANMVNTWMEAYNEKTKAIHGQLFIASTLRYKHSKPNSANIPGVRHGKDGVLMGEAGMWTYESRDLWTCGDPKEWDLVGIDGKGMQLRNLAHYLNLPAFTEAILSDDPHTANMKTFGLSSRSLTKTITYATLMGAGDARIANEAKVTLDEAKAGKAAFFRAVPTLPELIKRLQDEVAKTGRITLIDGTKVIVPSPHMVIPYLLQGDESRLMKQALIFLDEAIRLGGNSKWCFKVADIHDEWQWRIKREFTEEFVATALPCFVKAGESFNYNIRIDGDAKVGKTWAETH